MSGRFAHQNLWGAEVLDENGARFRLWGPGVDSVRLVRARDGHEISMERLPEGWFETTTDLIKTDEPYAFRLPDGFTVPDPAARAQVGDVHGASLLIDPRAYDWQTASWQGRAWEDAVVYEIHTGTFTEAGTFGGIESRLDYLVETGITAIELMPVAQFGGNRGWGYDGVLMYAPHQAYGGQQGLKSLVDAAHSRGLMVLLDVVYNHFGPDGNYLHIYAPTFFDSSRETPWGKGIAYDVPAVRAFITDNVLYWLEEYCLDGLRFDAINEIKDPSDESIMEEIGRTVRARLPNRHIHLTTEDDRNITRLHERDDQGNQLMYTAEWNDDFHHAAHVIATGESEGYYIDYAGGYVAKLARSLAEGFAYQGEESVFWGDAPRGVPSAHQPPTAFINFIQNHDQIGNRAFNERLTDLAPRRVIETLTTILLLSPSIPLLFMGEEWGELNPFGFFTDFQGELADAVREGRRREFRRFERFADEANRAKIPDPNAESTFLSSRIDWDRLDEPEHRERLSLIRNLLSIRHREIVPRLKDIAGYAGSAKTLDDRALGVRWRLGDGSFLTLIANLSGERCDSPLETSGRVLFESKTDLIGIVENGALPGWSVLVLLDETTLDGKIQ